MSFGRSIWWLVPLAALIFPKPINAALWERPVPAAFLFQGKTQRGRITREGSYAVQFRLEGLTPDPIPLNAQTTRALERFWEPGTHPLDHYWFLSPRENGGRILADAREGGTPIQFFEMKINFRNGEPFSVYPQFFAPGEPRHALAELDSFRVFGVTCGSWHPVVMLAELDSLRVFGVTCESRHPLMMTLHQLWGAARIRCLSGVLGY
jgi:hypothetical protein